MKLEGTLPANVEVGNAWNDLYPTGEPTNWIVGDWKQFIPATSLRFVAQDKGDPPAGAIHAKHVSVKWFVHEPAHPAEWGMGTGLWTGRIPPMKPVSTGRTFSILTNTGKFSVMFLNTDDSLCTITLDTPGDFIIWGDGVRHCWRPIERSVILTVRWEPLPPVT
jgi:hypothetical protein